MKKALWLALPLILAVASCSRNQSFDTSREDLKEYLHISHTRTDANPHIDPLVEQLDFSKFDMLWLGGDLAHSTSSDDQTMLHVDSIFDLGNKNTLWAPGNHDYSNLNRIRSYTGRSTYYVTYHNGISFFVMDTQDSMSNIIGPQKALLEAITDTIQRSSHLVILHHKLIWMSGNPLLEAKIPLVSNAETGDCFYCINPNNFYEDIYSKLLDVKQRGIDVICIGGDIGFQANEFEYSTPEGIYFLASGINSGSPENKLLIFHHNLANNELSWEYKLVSELAKK